MAQYDIVFVRNVGSTGIAFDETVLAKPSEAGMFLTQNPTSGALSWSKYHWVASGNDLSYMAGNVGVGVAPGVKFDVAGAIRSNNQLISTVASGTAPLAVASTTHIPNLNADLLDNLHGASYYKDADVVMNTNPFGGRPLYINSIDNAMYAADKKWWVIRTVHNVSHNSETYPKLNPDWVASYTVTGSGTSFVVTGAPTSIIVYNGDTICTIVASAPSGQYQCTYVAGTLTFGATVTGTIYAYPDQDVPKYLDSPAVSTYYTSSAFDGSYETQDICNSGQYMKIRVQFSEDGKSGTGGYPYGQLFLSYYYTYTPASANLRIFNRNYRPHGIGWSLDNFVDFKNTNASSNYIQSCVPTSAYGRTIMEFIIIGHSSHGTYLTQIDWKLDRPNLSTSGGTVTKFGANSLYDNLNFAVKNVINASITPAGYFSGKQFGSTIPTGTAPLVVASTTLVTNLNADLLDGLHASAFALAGHTHPSTMVYPVAGIPLSTGSAWGTSIVNNSANWNTAYGWGNHAGLYAPASHYHNDAAGWNYDSGLDLIYTPSIYRRVSVGSNSLVRNSAFQVYNADRSYAEMLVYTDDANYVDLNVIAVTNGDQLTTFRGLVVNSLVGSKPSTVECPSLVLAGFVGDAVSGLMETSFARLYPDINTIVHGLKINHIYDPNPAAWIGSYGSLFIEPSGTAVFDIYNHDSSAIATTLRLLDQNSNMIEFRVDPYNAGINEIISNQSMVLSGNGTGVYLAGGGVGFGESSPSAHVHIAAGGNGRAPLKFTSGTNLTTPQSGAMEWDGTRMYLTNSARQTLAYLKDVGLRASQTAVINATAHLTPTVIVGTDVGTNVIPANTFAVGDELITKIAGVFNTVLNTPQNITVRVLLNSTVIKTITGMLPGSASAWDWTGELTFTIKTAGATGKGLLTGMFFMDSRGAGYVLPIPFTVTSEIDINTTQNNTITVDAQWANSGNSLKSIHSSVKLERVN